MTTTTATASTVSVRAPDAPKHSTPLQVTSTSFREGDSLSMDHVFTGAGGKNRSPQLAWTGAPDGTKGYAITCFDPDAPTGSGYWHWVAFNIPAKATSLDENAGSGADVPGGKHGVTDFGMTSYCGPYPPKGDGPHRYTFTVYALDVERVDGGSEKTTGATINFLMRGHVLASGSIMGKFGH